MKIEINRLLAPVTALGPGRRLALWVQGCDLRCQGCASRDTWDRGAGTVTDTAALAALMAGSITEHGLDGITITGGEPLQQAEPLAELLSRVRAHAGLESIHVLMFTGYAWPAARRRAERLWDLVDGFVCGPYRLDRPPKAGGDPLVASANQRVIHLRPPAANPPWPKTVELQMMIDGDDLLMVGLPGPGDLDRIRQRLADRGVALEAVSWQN
ncbi:MAG: radical SAM protein [Bifidobacteriaceae bacterium]|jgi:anaerobic ribonucleoside-triphosphate reductase activating protein|nr:radical SAM protein [Bifidobacteriaceae bacterium]